VGFSFPEGWGAGVIIFFFLFLGEVSFHLPSLEFILSDLDLSSSNSNKQLLEEIAADGQIAVQGTIA
jgi:hypothetical protein